MSNGLQETQDIHVKLYGALVDQLQKYNSIIWQAPTAMLAANGYVLDKFRTVPLALIALSFLNAAIVFAFYKMVVQQQRIIEATQRAEEQLKKEFQPFIPAFRPSVLRAPLLMVITLSGLDLFLLFYGMVLAFCHSR